MALSQGLICTKRVHLGLSEVAFILYTESGVLTSGVAFVRGSTVIQTEWLKMTKGQLWQLSERELSYHKLTLTVRLHVHVMSMGKTFTGVGKS